MNSEEFIHKKVFSFSQHKLTKEEEKMIQLNGVEKYIYSKIASTKYRSKKVPKKLAGFIRSIIKLAIEKGEQITISVPFGGYKKWQYPSAPNVDWAEVFNIRYLIEYLSPISAVYKPGVVLHYFSDEIFISRMNDISQTDIDTYNNEFANLCNHFNELTPKKLQVKFSKIRDFISQKELMKRLDKAIEKLELEWHTLAEEVKKARLAKSERNFKCDLSKQTQKEKYEILKQSTLVHDAFIFGDWDEGVHWAFESNMIPIGFRYTGEWGIQLRSSRGSAVQFWVGYGVLEKRDGKFIPRIYSYKKFKQVEKQLCNVKVSSNHPLIKLPVLELENPESS